MYFEGNLKKTSRFFLKPQSLSNFTYNTFQKIFKFYLCMFQEFFFFMRRNLSKSAVSKNKNILIEQKILIS